jgi:hypothetical protein
MRRSSCLGTPHQPRPHHHRLEVHPQTGPSETPLLNHAGTVLVGQQYALLGKAPRGLVRRYIEKMTGLSRAQVTRLIARYTASGRVQVTVYRRRRFAQLYTRADIELLASVDEAHETLSGPATRRILEREHLLYKQPEYARLAAISVAHLYNCATTSATASGF